MTQLPSTSIRKLTALALAALGLGALAGAAPAPAAAALTPGGLVPYILGGQLTAIEQVPWQVYIEGGPFEEGASLIATACGGSILDATHVLTAAHCTDVEGTTVARPAHLYKVLAGDSFDNPSLSSTKQEDNVASIRRDPLYSTSPIGDDVAILTLTKPLELSPAKDAQAIPLVAPGATPPPGTPLQVSGYGKEEGGEAIAPNGGLFSTTLRAISSDACRSEVGPNSAVLLCAVSASSSTCLGDSGGALTQGSPAVQVGIVDFGPKECPVGQPDMFTNLAAPEIRDFIEGSESPPLAARSSSPPTIRAAGSSAVDYGPLTCQPGGWSGAQAFTYSFQTETSAPQVLQSGPADVFTPPASVVGVPLVCIVQASNAGGVSTARSATTPPIASDREPPLASIRALRCHLQACTLSIEAYDPNGALLDVRPRASYSVTARCPVKRAKKARGPVKARLCRRVKSVSLKTRSLSSEAYQATASRLPYRERVTFAADVRDAAGLHARGPLTRSTTLRPPPKRRPHR